MEASTRVMLVKEILITYIQHSPHSRELWLPSEEFSDIFKSLFRSLFENLSIGIYINRNIHDADDRVCSSVLVTPLFNGTWNFTRNRL